MTTRRNPPINVDVPTWYALNADEQTRSADVYLYESIGGWFGVYVNDFVKELAALDVDTIHLYVNSPGGDVFDAFAIMNALHRHPAKVTATVDGLAASAASYIVQAADEIVMGRGAQLMIHDAWSLAIGNADEMREGAAHLDRISDSIADVYAERAGGTREAWRDLMRAETWYTADEAVEVGLADRVDRDDDKSEQTTADALARFGSMFAYAGRDQAPAPRPTAGTHRGHPGASKIAALAALTNPLAPAPRAAAHRLPAEPEELTPDKEGATDMASDEFMKGIRDRLGIQPDADLTEEQTLAALDEALAEQTADPTPAPATVPEGTVLLDSTEHERLTAAAAELDTVRAERAAEHRAHVVDEAVNTGRIPPARREHWLAQLEADPGAEEVLAALAPNTIPVAANGYTGGVEEAPDDDRTYSTIYPQNPQKEA